ncbi:MAG: M14-type cytosolic carboxypeptidase [Kiritimatiellae bacterium]|nr:M14-type cytosolic carboxypeptidase [Kiritimatiellia bacterium]MDD5520957.1 M14-type cytosolic carboxypeptidase [Kiritimatiellia bacterium]
MNIITVWQLCFNLMVKKLKWCSILFMAYLLTVPAMCADITITTDFEGGMLGQVEKLSDTHFLCHVPGQADNDGRNRQVSWYFFCVNNAKGSELTFTLTDLRGEYNYKPGGICITDQSPPVVSTDGKNWRHLTTMRFDKVTDRASFTITPESDHVWIAHVEPYTAGRLDQLLGEIRGHPDLKDEVIGKSVEGRNLHLLTISDTARKETEKPVVWLMCRQHAWESGTSFLGEGAIRFLLSDEGKSYRNRVLFKIFPMADPDGCANGAVRFNRNGYDVNRNWDSADPLSVESRRLMPEICAMKKVMIDFGRMDFFLALHNQERDEWISGSEKHNEIVERFFARLVRDTTFNPSARGPIPSHSKPAPGRFTVYEFLDKQLGKPAFLMEQGIASSSKLGHYPTSKDRLNFGRQLARTMCEVVLEK